MCKILANERGFAAIWGVLLLAVISLLAGSAYILSLGQAKFAERVIADTQLRLAAESAVAYQAARLASDEAARTGVLAATAAKKIAEASSGDINTVVFAAGQGGKIKLLATAATARLKSYDPNALGSSGTRAIAFLAETGGTWHIERWEH